MSTSPISYPFSSMYKFSVIKGLLLNRYPLNKGLVETALVLFYESKRFV